MFKSREANPLFFSHIAGRIERPSWPVLPLELVWEIFCQLLNPYSAAQFSKINAFVIAPNSFQLLLAERQTSLAHLPQRLAQGLEAAFQAHTGQNLQLFTEAPDQFLVTDVKELRFIYRHIYQTPLREGLTVRAEDYPFSTLFYLLGRRCTQTPLTVTDTFGLCYDPARTLDWINDLTHEKEFWHLH